MEVPYLNRMSHVSGGGGGGPPVPQECGTLWQSSQVDLTSVQCQELLLRATQSLSEVLTHGSTRMAWNANGVHDRRTHSAKGK